MRKTILVLVSVALAMLLISSGVALAANITCPTGKNGLCVGTNQNDTLTGTDARDIMRARAGNDTLYGKGYGDTLEGDGGTDTLIGQGGRDTLYGDTQDSTSPVHANDRLVGGRGDDTLYGGPGNDRIKGGPGNDHIESILSGDAARLSNNDTVHGQDGNDFIEGGSGARYGEGGNDFLSANGDAQFFGGRGIDQLCAGTLVSKDVGFTQVVNGGPGEDNFAVCVFLGAPGSKQPPDDITYLADDGEHDRIVCSDVKRETVRADPLDTFPAFEDSTHKTGRQYCDHLTIVR